MSSPGEITLLLRKSGAGDRGAFDALFEALYAELYQLAESQRHRWSGNYTLNSTALVHEAYLKMVGRDGAEFRDRSHFLGVAARAIRHVLINYAEARRTAKRGGGREGVALDEASPLGRETAEEILALHAALQALEEVHDRAAKVVEARFFGGFTIEETADILDVSPTTVKRDWLMASAWLHREIGGARA